jgi:hypothetical protein
MFRPFAVALLLAVPVVATAAEAETATTDQGLAVTINRAGELAVGGVVLVQLRDKSVCESMSQRADRITSRLVNALERIHRRSRFKQIRVAVAPPAPDEPPGEPWVVVEGVRLFKVTYQDAVAAKRPAAELAAHYANQVRRGLRRIYTP